MKNTEQIRVCKQFFLKTLSISHGPVDKAFEGIDDNTGLLMNINNRGKAPSVNKSSDELIANINAHITKFSTVESHYCRFTTKRQYLESNLSTYALYVQECNEKNQNYVSLPVYKKIFCENHNLSFYKSKKDQCLTFEKYKNSEKPQPEEIYLFYKNSFY